MDLSDQVDLIKEHWRLLLEAAERASIPDHTLLNALGALLAVLLAHQEDCVVAEWMVAVEDHVQQVRNRQTVELDP